MSKRITRNALVLAAAGLLGATGVVTTAGAQTVINPQQTITNSLKVVGPVPAGVTGVTVYVKCKDLVGATTQTYAANLPVAGGTGVMNFNLQANTSCIAQADVSGTAPNHGLGSLTINIGGTDRDASVTTASNTLQTVTTTTPFVSTVLSRHTGEIPVGTSTNIVVTLTYPQITVKKVVAGDGPDAGFAYPMTIACSGAGGTGFINGLVGGCNGSGQGTSYSLGSGAGAGDIMLPGGAGSTSRSRFLTRPNLVTSRSS